MWHWRYFNLDFDTSLIAARVMIATINAQANVPASTEAFREFVECQDRKSLSAKSIPVMER